MTNKGQITIGIGVALSVGTILASTIVGFFSSNMVTNEKISEDRQRISVIEADNENFKEWLTRVEEKLDRVIESK